MDADMDIDAVDGDMEMDLDAVDAVDGEVDMDADMVGDVEDEENVMYEIALDENDNWTGSEVDGGFEEDQAYANAEGPIVMNEKDVDESLEEGDDLTEEDGVAEGDEVSEIARTKGAYALPKQKGSKNPVADKYKPAGEKVNESNKKYNTLLTEAKDLKAKNVEYKQALKQFRTMLAETVVFNSNLTYTTKLFMEHSTTRDEKEGIFNRFDNEVSTLKESKKLYKTIASELGSRKPMNESIGNKMNKEVTSSSSTQLNESTAYVDKETSRIMDLMKRVDNK